ncbi:hypothetical protein KY308_01810, partial [Candidatus Woesearchaeota archaeon]|nr:hypothetical protein [Candidatus Woesearchaeota archaeon]
MKKVAIIIAFALCACFANAQIYLGTVDGYIFYMNNSLAVGANVSALVVGCSGGGCSGNTLSQSNGYYVIANLNLASGGTVKVNATKSPAYGNSSGIANEFDAARVNVTLCIAPSSPALIDQTNTHDTNVTLYWTSGTDPLSLSTYDQYQLDSGTITTQTSPKTETNLSYQTHTWRVRTCNTNGATGCCSAWSSDSFQVYNNAPSVPILVDQGNTHDTNVTLYWTSGTDSDGDPTYDQFQMDSGAIINTTSPKYEENLSYQTHTWKVRTCDVLGACSNWAQDSFDVQNSYPSAPVLEDQYPTNQSYVIVNWTSGTDPDGDPVRDEFQFSTDYNFSTLFYNSTNASHPLNVSGLTTLTIYYW